MKKRSTLAINAFIFGVLAGITGCVSTYIPSADVSGLMPKEAAQNVIKKHFGESWLLSPTVKGSGFSAECNNTVKPVTLDKFASGTYNPGPTIGGKKSSGRFSIITGESRWTSCAMVVETYVGTADDAKALVEAINSLGGKIVSIYGF